MHKIKFGLLFLVILVFTITIVGCKTKIGLKDIEKQLFKNVVYVGLSAERIRRLDDKEMEILKRSIGQGSELTEIFNANEVPRFNYKDGIIVFIFEWSDNYSGNLVYESNRNYMYIGKMQVYRNKNFMPGIYKFQPSPEIRKLVSHVYRKEF
jgi:hypothetical protein